MQEGSQKTMEVNIELRLNVDEQKDDKTFQVKSDMDDSYEVKEISNECTSQN